MHIFKGKLFNLYTKRQKLPNGYRVELEVIKHPGAALIVPLLTRNKVILIKQYRPVINQMIYELPAGTLDKNEKPLHCAKREIIEEIGYRAGRFTYLNKIYPVPGYSTEVIHIFKAEQLTKTKQANEPDEIIQTYIFSKAEIKQLFHTGKIIDSKTISAFALCKWL